MAADPRPAIESALETALSIVAEPAPSASRIGAEEDVAAMTAVSDALFAMGDRRFSDVRLRYLGEEGADEGEPEGAAGP